MRELRRLLARIPRVAGLQYVRGPSQRNLRLLTLAILYDLAFLAERGKHPRT